MIELNHYYFGQEAHREKNIVIRDRRTNLYEHPGMYEHMCQLVKAGGGELPEPYDKYRLDLEPLGTGALYTISRKGKVEREFGFAPDMAGAMKVWPRLLELWHEYRPCFTAEEQQVTPVMPPAPWCAYVNRQGNFSRGDDDESGPRKLELIKLEHYMAFLLAKLAGLGIETISPNGVIQNPLVRDPLITRYNLDTGEVDTFRESDRAVFLADEVTNLCRHLICAKKDYQFRFECCGTTIDPSFKTVGLPCGGVLTLQLPGRQDTAIRSYYANIEDVADNIWTEVESEWFRLTESRRVTHRLHRPPTPWVVKRVCPFAGEIHAEAQRFINDMEPGMIITLNQEARRHLVFGR